jgi:hypothetical protein
MCTVQFTDFGNAGSSHNSVDSATNREFEALGRLSARVQISVRQGLVLLAGLLLAIVQWYLPLQKSTSGEYVC